MINLTEPNVEGFLKKRKTLCEINFEREKAVEEEKRYFLLPRAFPINQVPQQKPTTAYDKFESTPDYKEN